MSLFSDDCDCDCDDDLILQVKIQGVEFKANGPPHAAVEALREVLHSMRYGHVDEARPALEEKA